MFVYGSCKRLDFTALLPGQGVIAVCKGLQKGGRFLLCGKMTQADAPGGKGVAPVLTDCKHCAGRQPIGRTGGFDRDAYPACVQLPLEHGTLYALHTQVQDMWHSVCRAVDAYFWIAGKLCTQPVIQAAHSCGAGWQLRSSLFQSQRQRAGKGYGRCAAAVGCNIEDSHY